MRDLLRTLIKPNWDDNPERTEVLHAANLLQIGEFQLIQLAYKSWYQEDLPEHKINKIFNEYMITGIIPIWVKLYAQDIIKLEKANVLEFNNEKYHAYDHEFGKHIDSERQRKRRGIGYAIIIVFVFIFSHFMAIKYVDEPAGFYPPYIEKRVVYPELYEKDPAYGWDKR